MDYRDQQLHDFEEHGTRSDCIPFRSFESDFERIMEDKAPTHPVISMDDWDKSTPIDSLFDVIPKPASNKMPTEARRVLPPEHTKRGAAENRLEMIKSAVEKDAEQ